MEDLALYQPVDLPTTCPTADNIFLQPTPDPSPLSKSQTRLYPLVLSQYKDLPKNNLPRNKDTS